MIDNITLKIHGVATLSLSPRAGCITCLTSIPDVVAAAMDPTMCYPSDSGASFSISATQEFRSAVMRRGKVIGTLTAPIFAGPPASSFGIHFMPISTHTAGEEINVWIGNQLSRIKIDADPRGPAWWRRPLNLLSRWATFVLRGIDDTPMRRVDIPLESTMVGYGGQYVTRNAPWALEGLKVTYTLHYADGTDQVMLGGQIRSVQDSGDTVRISIGTELSSVLDQEWLPPRSMPGLYSDRHDFLRLNDAYRAQIAYPSQWNSYAIAPLQLDHSAGRVISGGMTATVATSAATPLINYVSSPQFTTPDLRQNPVLSMGSHVGPDIDDGYWLKSDRMRVHPNYFPQHGVNPLSHTMFAVFAVADAAQIEKNNNQGIDITQQHADKSAFALLQVDYRTTTNNGTPWGDVGLYGSVAYHADLNMFQPSDWLGLRDLYRDTSGVYSKADGWDDAQSLPQVRFGVAGEIIPLPRAPSLIPQAMDFFAAQVLLGSAGNSYGVGLDGLQSSLTLYSDLLNMRDKVREACNKYFQSVYNDASFTTNAALDSVAASLLVDENIPLEFVWGRTFKDTFFSDIWAQYAIVFVSGRDALIRPVFLGDDISTPTASIGIRDVVDLDHTVQFAIEPVLGSVLYKGVPERYAYADSHAENIEMISGSQGVWGSRGDAISIPLSPYLRRDPFSYIRQQASPYTGPYTPIDVSMACWSAALRNYGKPYPTVVLNVGIRWEGLPGDIVSITLPNMPNPFGAIGVENMIAQVWERGYNVQNGTSEVKLLLVGWYDD